MVTFYVIPELCNLPLYPFLGPSQFGVLSCIEERNNMIFNK